MAQARVPHPPARRYGTPRSWATLRQFLRIARRENIPRLMAGGLAIMSILACACFAFEYGKNAQFQTVWDAIWWAFVTMMTVGYGDKVPATWPGRFVAVWLMAHGFIIMSFFTAAVASFLVEKRMREDKGLGRINLSGHIVICGWNQYAEHVMRELADLQAKEKFSFVLVNDMEEDEISDILFRYPETDVRFVKGDFTQETVLRRANVGQARAAIILADPGQGSAVSGSDQRTIIATLAVKTVAPDVITCAELLEPSNREHLERARVDAVIVRGEHSGFLLANAAMAPGVPAAVRELLASASGHALAQVPIPQEFIGRSFHDLLSFFRQKKSAILIGLVREKKAITLDDILSSDYSAIDRFIKQKFEDAERDFFGGREKQGVDIQLNPGDDYLIREDEAALIVTQARDA